MKRLLLSIALLLLAAVAGVAGLLIASYSPAAPVYEPSAALATMTLPLRLRDRQEHDRVRSRIDDAPYVLEFTHEGSVLFYGAHHTNDPDDPQLADIERRWRSFRPTVALYEGRQRSFFDTSLLDPIKGKSEAEKLHHLATEDGVRIYSLEPSYRNEVAKLRERWSAEEVALYFFTRVYWGESGGDYDEELALDLLRKRTDVEGLRGSLVTLADVDDLWRKRFSEFGDWRTLSSEPRNAFFTEINDASRRVRGEHMVRTIVDLTRRGERVFAVVGSGHVIRTEWMLRKLLGATPAGDQPIGS